MSMNKNYSSPAISVLIPVYKVEAYLQRCIDSVLSQDFTDWEMILVNDGSPDKCPQICDENAAKYPKKIRVIHKKNSGLLSARKEGVREAKGKYYVFLDSDDTLYNNGALSILYNHIEKGYDMVRGGGIRKTNNGLEYSLEKYKIEEGEICGDGVWALSMYKGEIAPYIWGAIYKASLFKDEIYDIPIQQGINMGEDWVINMIIAKDIYKTLYIKDLVYNYYVNHDSYMSTYVMSTEYWDKVELVLKQSHVYENKAIEKYAPIKKCIGIINNFFVPEFTFNKQQYEYVVYFLKDKEISNNIKSKVPNKRIKFIHCYPFFRIYIFIYKILYKYYKLKGKRRKVY